MNEDYDVKHWGSFKNTAHAILSKKMGKCFICLSNKNFADSHTIPKSLLKEWKYMYCFASDMNGIFKRNIKLLENYTSNNLKEKIRESYLFHYSVAGTFKSICPSCEADLDDYENNIKQNINCRISSQDCRDLFLKGFLKNTYNLETSIRTVKTVNDSIYKPSFLHGYLEYYNRKLQHAKAHAKKVQNEEEQPEIIWDSKDFDYSINLKCAIFKMIDFPVKSKINDALPLLIVLLPGENESRLLLLSLKNFSENLILKKYYSSLNFHEIVYDSIKKIVEYQFSGLFIPQEFDIFPFYENFLIPELNDINKLKLVNYIVENFKYDALKPYTY